MVRGRCVAGSGDGMTGFSLSLPCSDTSLPLLSGWVVLDGCRGGAAGRAGGAHAPEDDLGLVDDVAVVVGGGQARDVPDRAVDVGDLAARAADEVVVVVADPCLVPRHRA